MKGKEEYQELRRLIDELERRGVVAIDERGRIRYGEERHRVKSSSSHRIVGRIRVSRKGVGTVRVEGTGEEIVIPPKFMGTAFHGDTVAVVPFARPLNRQRYEEGAGMEGEVVEIVERTVTTLTGRLEESRNFSFVVPDDDRVRRDIYVTDEDAGKAKHGDKVVVRLHPWEDPHLNPEGTIIEVLGPSGDARVEVLSVARSHGLPIMFSSAVQREAERLPDRISEEEIRKRVDVRSTVCFTIDPADAKDFDDALSLELLENGRVRLGVHIADVSHYVKEGTCLDAEALARGTSVYLVNEVIPMLPERLSNDLCSLRPHEDRLTYSVLMDVSGRGVVESYSIDKTIIHSARRFTYEEVQKIIEKRKGPHSNVILPLFALSQVLTAQRRRSGSIDFDTGETKFRFDEHGLPSEIIKNVRLDAHRLVEECMLLANRVVAEHIGRRRDVPFLYRVHDVPDPSRLADLADFVKQFGFALDARNGVSALALQRLLDKVEGSEVENLIKEITLRSMAKAVYSERNIGHYGLAFKYYTHFTSPIRRYPDLVVHRLLHEYKGAQAGHRAAALRKMLPVIARQSSERERVAVDAERASVKVMQAEYMKRHLGDEFEGVIGGVTNFGIFVEINELLVEGLVRMRDLADDYYLFDEKHYALRGRSRGKIYRLGDHVRVKVVAVNPAEREIDFAIVKKG